MRKKVRREADDDASASSTRVAIVVVVAVVVAVVANLDEDAWPDARGHWPALPLAGSKEQSLGWRVVCEASRGRAREEWKARKRSQRRPRASDGQRYPLSCCTVHFVERQINWRKL